MRVADFQGARVYRLLPEGQRTKKDGTPKDPKRLGKVHLPVFTPDGRTVVGFMVKLPDIAGMIKQEDRFVALDALDVRDGQLVVADMRESYDVPAAKRLGVDLDACIIWTGMDVVTKAGKKLGYCADVTCHPRTGAVQEFLITPGAASSALIGHITMPVDMLVGYKRGAMVVADEAAALEFSGGAAAKAAFEGHSGEMVGLRRLSNDPYQCTTELHDIHTIANFEKKVPGEWITPDGVGVTQEFLAYMRPLIQAELTPIYVDGLPRHIYIK